MVLKRKNPADELLHERQQHMDEERLMEEVRAILAHDESERAAISRRLLNESGQIFNNFDISLLETGNIFHISQIRSVCIDYRLRFLDSCYFKAAIPEEAVSKIKWLEKQHDIMLQGFKVMAPSKTFQLKNYDDPLLFAPIGNGYYYLIHKWGNDLGAFRKWLVRPFRDLGSFLVLLILISLLLTFSLAGLSVSVTSQETFLLLSFLFIFKSVCGIALYYCFWKGKNFNSAIWNSEFYNK